MERQLKSFWITALLLSTASASAGNSSLEDWIRRLTKPSKYLTLTSTKVESQLTPKLVSFKGSVKVPSYMVLSGSPRIHGQAGQFIVDGQIVCNYSPRSNADRYYVLQGCSDGTRGGEEIYVQNKLEVKLNQASSTKASLTAKVVVLRSEMVEYGINFPYIKAEEGQILMYNGEAWVPGDIEDLGLSGVKGDKGDKGDPGEMGPQGPAGYPGVAGAVGEKGDKGDKGDAGVAGAQGPKGDNGAAGATGPQGPAGAAGAIGPQGPKGDNGVAGAQGPVGPAGAIGPQGPKGDAGSVGATGPQGPAGAIGPQGPKGDAGSVGATGPQGPAGATGPQGPKGDAGPQGPAGVAGATGAAGSVGPQGPAGEMGPMGPQGPAGANGAVGATGPQGAQGPKGDRGEQGLAGAAGAQGPAGEMGPMGLPGAQGPAGEQGPAGAKGDKGDKGDRGLSEIAYLRDERVSGQNGGSCSAAAGFQTRSLNVLGGDVGFITLSANRFTLQPGKYFIEALVPALQTNTHQAKLKVIESNLDVMIGTTSFSPATGGSVTHSVISGEIVVSVASTFEIQHRCATDRVNTGFGMGANFGIGEVYTQVKIIKKQ